MRISVASRTAGEMTVVSRIAARMIGKAGTVAKMNDGKSIAAMAANDQRLKKWLPFVDDIRTALFENAAEIRGMIRAFGALA